MSEARNKRGKTFQWLGGTYSDFVEAEYDKRLDKASITAVVGIKASMKGSGITGTRSGASKGARRKAAANRKGQAPMVQTGRLKAAVTFARRGKLSRAIGVGVQAGTGGRTRGYAYILEVLSHRKGYRPYIIPWFKSHNGKLRKILAAPLPKFELPGLRGDR